MLCRDMKPNRLEMAKSAVEDLIRRLEGDRVALVAFSGAPQLLCPLTTDYGFFLTLLRELDTDTIQHGGTLIGDAVLFAAEKVFPETGRAYRDMIIITDGEDHGSFPEKAAEIAFNKKRIRMHIFGLGDDMHGAKVPVYDEDGTFTEYLKHDGSFVYSKLDEESRMVLERMAAATKGSFLYAGTASFDMGRLYRERILTAARRETSSDVTVEYREGYQVFVLAALVLMLAALFVRERS
jgi:Ca-activated chloride channel family protein